MTTQSPRPCTKFTARPGCLFANARATSLFVIVNPPPSSRRARQSSMFWIVVRLHASGVASHLRCSRSVCHQCRPVIRMRSAHQAIAAVHRCCAATARRSRFPSSSIRCSSAMLNSRSRLRNHACMISPSIRSRTLLSTRLRSYKTRSSSFACKRSPLSSRISKLALGLFHQNQNKIDWIVVVHERPPAAPLQHREAKP